MADGDARTDVKTEYNSFILRYEVLVFGALASLRLSISRTR